MLFNRSAVTLNELIFAPGDLQIVWVGCEKEAAMTIDSNFKNRGVKRLCHFTHLENLPSIATHGLLSRDELSRRDIRFRFNDSHRLENQRDHVCCSIQVPNAYLMKRFSLEIDGVILAVDTGASRADSTLVSRHNAATGMGLYLKDLSDLSLDQCFEKQVGRYWRNQNHLSYCPTNLQAEILISKCVPIDKIVGVIVPSREAFERAEPLISNFASSLGIPVGVSRTMFCAEELSDACRNGDREALLIELLEGGF